MASKGSGRVTFRLDQERLDRLEKHCHEAGIDTSRAIRAALDAYLPPASEASPSTAAVRSLAPPNAIIPLTRRYLGWGDGDLRRHFKTSLQDVLAEAFACRKLYPRSPGMAEIYENLLHLWPYFGPEV